MTVTNELLDARRAVEAMRAVKRRWEAHWTAPEVEEERSGFERGEYGEDVSIYTLPAHKEGARQTRALHAAQDAALQRVLDVLQMEEEELRQQLQRRGNP